MTTRDLDHATTDAGEADRLTLEVVGLALDVVKAARAHVFTCKREGCHDDLKVKLAAYGRGRTATPRRPR